jgi:uncharacterized repeat protein (TIGR01451 family)
VPANVTIAATPNASTNCGAGTLTATAGGSSVVLANGSIAASATCAITVSVTGTVAGAYTNTIAANVLTDTQGAGNSSAATADLTIAPAAVTLSKIFAPASIIAGAASTLTITLPNTAAAAVALTSVSLSDALPTGLTIAAAPNATTTCGAGTLTATAGGSSVALANGSVAANATCTIAVGVTGTVTGGYTNTIPANALSDTQSVSNGSASTANLTITPASMTLSKVFAPASITSGGTSTLTITLPNTAAGAVALTNVALTDPLPTGLAIAATPNAVTTCGTVTATAGGHSVALTNGSIAANAICTITVSVTGTIVGNYTNTIAASALADTQTVTNGVPATADLTIAPASTELSKTFAPASIAAGGTSTLSITIPNTAAGAVALTNIALTDPLPTGLAIVATPNAATTCGTLTATAGGHSVAMANGSIAANATCTIKVSVTGTVAGSYTNTIAASALNDTQGVSNGSAATANLTITPASLTLAKTFAPATITAGSTSLLTITIPNSAAGAAALSAMALTDTLPSGLSIAATPNAATTCGAGTVAAPAAGSTVALSNGAVAANATCTITVSVTSSTTGSRTNTIPASALTTTQGTTNVAPVTALLNVVASTASLALAKSFSPGAIAQNATSTLTITLSNTAPGAIAVSSLGLTDGLPPNVTIAAIPNASTSCTGGTVTASARGTTAVLSGASLLAGATCTLGVSVTSSVAGVFVNTIAPSSLTDAQGSTNTSAAQATLNVGNASGVGVVKIFFFRRSLRPARHQR